MKTIAFYDNNLSIRGTTTAMFDYADYNEKILGNKSIILSLPQGDLSSYNKFKNRFGEKNVYLHNFYEYHYLLPKLGVDYCYITKSGYKSDGLCLENVPSLIHVVFRHNDPHGYKYVYISDWLAKDRGYDPNKYSVPYIVKRLPEPDYDLRDKLGISKNAIVFGYLGGSTEFNISDTHEVIKRVVKERPDIYFIFMNINKFTDDHKNIIHLPSNWELKEKSCFINACDAMIHARLGGETFGLSVAEFTIMNKPVVTYGNSGEKAHLEILEEKAILYHNYDELYDIINNVKSYIKFENYYEAYNDYSPEKIMERFNKNFLN